MAGWYRLDEGAAHQLSKIMATFSPRSKAQRMDMLLYCYSQTIASGKPCPYFKLGQRTIARHCGVTIGTARRFLESMEEQGWFVKVGKTEQGEYQKRAFWWLASDENSVQTGTEGSVQTGTEGVSLERGESTEGSVQTPCGKYAHQSAEHSDGALRSPADAGAQAQEPYPEADYNVDLMPVISRGGADA